MFIHFFYTLKQAGIPVNPTAFLTLQKALRNGLICNLNDFYTAARAILIKSERFFDLFDQIFAHYFEGAELPDTEGFEMSEMAKALLEEWLKDPETLSKILGADEEALHKLTPEELIDYFKKRLEEQKERHQGGSKWIGTAGTSPVGHSGFHPGGLRIGGRSQNRSAIKVAMERRYKDYSNQGPLTQPMIGEALKRLRHMIPSGPKDHINIDASIYETVRNAGEIEIIFDRALKDRLKVILAIDNGGWSMDPHISVVQTLFDYARSQFKDLRTYFFHNTIYDTIWKDAARMRQPFRVEEFARLDPETRLIVVGDASMAPYELMITDGSIHIEERSHTPSIDRLKFLSKTFPHCVWLNPVSENSWEYVQTIQMIQNIFPMYALSLDGLEKAVVQLMAA